MSTGRIDRTGLTASGIEEWNTGTSRVPLLTDYRRVAVQFDEDDVGLVQPALRVLVLVVRHLDRDGCVLRLVLVLEQLARQGPTRTRVHRR